MQKKIYIIILSFLGIANIGLAQDNNAAIEFIENKGQWDNSIKFKGLTNAREVYLLQNGFEIATHSVADMDKIHMVMHGFGKSISSTSAAKSINLNQTNVNNDGGGSSNPSNAIILHSHAYKVSFINASPLSSIIPEKALSYYNNYYIGNDPKQWASNCKIFQAITYKNIYPNIDVRYYTDKGEVKYDIIINPGGDINKIAMQYDGVIPQIKNNQLYIKTSVDEIQETLPSCYQYNKQNFEKQSIKVKYQLKNNIVTFKILGEYDKNTTLVIDPVWIFSTFTGSASDNWGYTATYGPDGSFYAGGIVFGNGFPTTPGAYQSSYQGSTSPAEGVAIGYDMGIIRFSPGSSTTNTNILYGTYIGGRNSDEQPHSLVVDKQGNLIIAGRTASNDYPNTSPFSSTPAGFDIVLTKLNTIGGLISSVRIGGSGADGVNIRPKDIDPGGATSLRQNYGEDARSEVILDASNNIYLASCTQSTNFPTTTNAFQTTLRGGQDGVILKFSSNLNAPPLFSSYLGGDGDDAAYVLALNPINNDIYIAGGTTSSTNFPGDKTGTIGPGYFGGTTDGFIIELNNGGTFNLVRSTYIGTTGIDQVYGIQFDKNGFVYIMGTTTGNWPVLNAKYFNPNGKQFIQKLNLNLSGPPIYSTVFGAGSRGPNISPIAFLVDRCENVYVSGWGGGINNGFINNFGNEQDVYNRGNTFGLPTTAGAINKSASDGADFYFFVLKRNADSILYGSFFGQNGGVGEHVDGGTSRFDKEGVIYQAICANCYGTTTARATFPTFNAYAPNNGSGACNLAAVKIAFDFAGIASDIQGSIGGVPRDTIGCLPLTVDFVDLIGKAKKYIWNFGDGKPFSDGTFDTTTIAPRISHTFNNTGLFTVRLVSVDSTSCNITDTSYTHIKVGDKEVKNLGFTYTRLMPCETNTIQFTNNSTAPLGTMFSDTAFGWDFGDGVSLINGRTNRVFTHNYPAPGTYKVKLVLRDTTFCNVFDTVEQSILVTPIVKAGFTAPTDVCVGYPTVFTNTTRNGDNDYRWNFGDNQTLTQNGFVATTIHTYSLPGTYPVKLVVRNDSTCNIIDSFTTTINVHDTPVSRFMVLPLGPPIVNSPNTFQDQSTNAVSYLWNFGDGETSTEQNPAHQYNSTGTFNACLTVTNQFGCKSTFCLPVQAKIDPLLDVPNAFTPGKFGKNAIIKVDGFGIGDITFRIFNRWGQKLFETHNRKEGWNGTFNGKLQPMDVYVYTLDVKFTDGTTTRKTGDITLIR